MSLAAASHEVLPKSTALSEIQHIPLTNLVIVSPRIRAAPNETGRTKGVRKIADEFGVSPSKVDDP